MEMSTADERPIVTLLRDISSSLAVIKNQQAALQTCIGRTNCCCSHECHSCIAVHEPIGHSTVGNGSTGRAMTQSSLSSLTHTDVLELDKDSIDREKPVVDLIEVPYDVPTPVEQHIRSALGARYKDVLDNSYVQDRLNCLPPDDYRLPLPATRGVFLKQFTSDNNPVKISGATIDKIYMKEVLRELNYFEEFGMKMGSGHFRIRDYDFKGCYTQWDCVNTPKVISSDVRDKSMNSKIPNSAWPLDWSIQHETPVAPWRRIM